MIKKSVKITKGQQTAHRLYLLLTTSLLISVATACDGGDDVAEADDVAKAFSEAYFNYDFNTAATFCTSESERWLRFAASNVYEADVKVLRNMSDGAKVEVDDIVYYSDDTTAVAKVNVTGAMVRDTVGVAGHVDGETRSYTLRLVKRGGRWLVRMEALPRSGK